MEYVVYKTRVTKPGMASAIKAAGVERGARFSLLWKPWTYEVVCPDRMEILADSGSGETTVQSRPGTIPHQTIDETAYSLSASSWFNPTDANYVSFIPEKGDEFEFIGDVIAQTQEVENRELLELEHLAKKYFSRKK